MHQALDKVAELLQGNNTFSETEKVALEKALKEADKALVVAEFKLGRIDKEKKALLYKFNKTLPISCGTTSIVPILSSKCVLKSALKSLSLALRP